MPTEPRTRDGRAPRVLVVEHEAQAPAALLGRWLVEAGAVLDVCRPYLGEDLPEDLAGHDVLLVLGGSMGAHDDAEAAWLPGTRALLREAAGSGVPALGVCLGHQLAAVALGGSSRPDPAGQQLGLLAVGWSEEAAADPLLGPLTGTARRGLHWNGDVVQDQPPGTVVLARAPGGELQAARFAPSVWGVQLHPEVDEHVVADWADDDPGEQPRERLDEVVRRVAAARGELEAAWRPLATSLLGLVGTFTSP
ncbi:GMP synthase (glutamine-hydrolysing) [Nocardioides scoriae]|uniref:GMP synthase (Glutamine-hydrolysing) n=1 Tax=Nocardioides scoriae TaxID=642780 RepID=A0A1H1MDL2_9ACTN|nr:type 1 glutamine amidotransferase [Nocardioides scoriae]SDR84069.1 GMP synthase (glutamine-hydrolysing) [Nocardioides scoriae]